MVFILSFTVERGRQAQKRQKENEGFLGGHPSFPGSHYPSPSPPRQVDRGQSLQGYGPHTRPAAPPSAGACGEVRHTAAARGRERPGSSRDGPAGNRKDRGSSREEGWQRGERDPASPPNSRPPRTVQPPSRSHPPEGPTRICARRVTSEREGGRRALSAPHPPRGPKPAPCPRPAGRRRPDLQRGMPGGPDPRASRRPLRNNG